MSTKNNQEKLTLKDFVFLYVLFPLKEVFEKITNTEEHLTQENKMIINTCNTPLKRNKKKLSSETSYKIGDKVYNKSVSSIISSSNSPLSLD